MATLKVKAAEKPWTPYRIAKIRKAIRDAFEEASIACGRFDSGEEIEATRARVEESADEAMELVRVFAAMVKAGATIPGK